MRSATRPGQCIRFKAFELDLHSGELRRHELTLKVQGQPIELLAALLERPGELVTRKELRRRLWPAETFVDFEHGLNIAVNKLRTALCDRASSPRYIETLTRRGYRFIAPVDPPANLSALAVGAPVPASTAARMRAGRTRLRNSRPAERQPLPQIASLGVLPLANLSGDAQEEYLADGMTDALITNLGKIGALRVISRQSVVRYKGSAKPLPEIARELNVDGIVEGTVQRIGGRVRVTAQLLQGTNDRQLWAESYERDAGDLLALQRDVGQAVATEIRAKVTPEETRRLMRTPHVSAEAYEAYLKGQFHWYCISPGHLDLALSYFEQALEKDPACALAHVGIANVWLLRGDAGFVPPQTAFSKARVAVQKALEIDDVLSEAHLALANVVALCDWDWAAGEREFRRSIELNPNSADAHMMYADFLASMLRWAVAVPEMQCALQLDPVSPFLHCFYGWHLVYRDRCDEAIQHLRKALAAEAGFSSAHMGLWGAFYKKGVYEEAVAEARRFFAALSDHEVEEGIRRGYAEGSYEQAMQEGAKILAQRSLHTHVPAVRVARLYAHAGRKGLAMAWLQRAYEQRESPLLHLAVAWDWDLMRDDARFRELVRRVGLPE